MMKTGEKLSEQLLCDVCIRLVALHIFWTEQSEINVSVETEKEHLGTLLRVC